MFDKMTRFTAEHGLVLLVVALVGVFVAVLIAVAPGGGQPTVKDSLIVDRLAADGPTAPAPRDRARWAERIVRLIDRLAADDDWQAHAFAGSADMVFALPRDGVRVSWLCRPGDPDSFPPGVYLTATMYQGLANPLRAELETSWRHRGADLLNDELAELVAAMVDEGYTIHEHDLAGRPYNPPAAMRALVVERFHDTHGGPVKINGTSLEYRAGPLLITVDYYTESEPIYNQGGVEVVFKPEQ